MSDETTDQMTEEVIEIKTNEIIFLPYLKHE